MPNPLLAQTALVARITPLSRGTVAVAAAMTDRTQLTAPKSSGVYAFVDRDGVCVYIGKSRCLRARLSSYLRSEVFADKAYRIRCAAETIFWEELPDELAALLREIELIHYWEPRLNVQFRPNGRRRTWVGLGVVGGLPQFFMAAQKPRKTQAAAIAGPFSGSARLGAALAVINERFQRRVRPDALVRSFQRGEDELVAAALSKDEGRALIVQGQRLLRGVDRRLEREIRVAMAKSAAAEAFELAACHRDELRMMIWLRRRISETRRARRSWNFVYPVTLGTRVFWYVIRGGLVRTLVEVPDSAPGQLGLVTLLTETYAADRERTFDEDALTSDHLATLVAWFRARPVELRRVLTPDEALAWCGGKPRVDYQQTKVKMRSTHAP